MHDLPPFLTNSTLPQWLSAIFTGGIFLGVLRFILGWRSQSLNSEEAIRDHYANEVAALRKERAADHAQFISVEKHLRTMLHESEQRHEECQLDRDELRRQVVQLQGELDGIKRQISQYSADKLLILEDRTGLPSKRAPDATASASRVKRKSEA